MANKEMDQAVEFLSNLALTPPPSSISTNKEMDQAVEILPKLTFTPPPSLSPPPPPSPSIPTTNYKGFNIPPLWEGALDSITYSSDTCLRPIVFICGPGNSGKSLFSRVLLDTLFKRYERVGYLDTDVGQPEFTPPGCVSLHIVENQTPIFSYLFQDFKIQCLETPEKCLFFGDVCATTNAKDYVQYVFELYDYFIKKFYKLENLGESDKPQMPLIINTSGWVKGFGFNVLVDMLRHMSPTHVVKVERSEASKNLPSGTFWLDSGDKANVEMIEICAAQKIAHSIPTKRNAGLMRALRFVAYFRQCLPKDTGTSDYLELVCLMACKHPSEISLSKISVTYLHCQESTGMAYQILKGMIVGLAISSSVPSSGLVSTPWCVGLGIVKSIDVEKDKIHLLTPTPLHIIQEVDVLLHGSIEAPFSAVPNPTLLEALGDRIKQLLKCIETEHFT